MSRQPTTRRTLIAAIATTAVLGLAACGSDKGGGTGGNDASKGDAVSKAPVAAAKDIPAGSTMAAIKKAGVLKVGATATSPLFSFEDPTTSKYTGFDAELTEMLAKYITGKPSVKRTQVTVTTRETLLQNKTVNVVVATYSITPDRAKLISFAGPYFADGDVVLVRKDEKSITKVGDLNGKKVVTETGSTAEQDLKKYAPQATVSLLDENDQCLQALIAKRADAYVLDQAIVGGDALQNPTKVKVVGKPFTSEPYGIGVNKNDTQFKSFVNGWLRTIEKDGSWDALWKETIGKTEGGSPPMPPKIGSVPGS